MLYRFFKVIQVGHIPFRRWSMRLALLTIGANLWMDHILNYLLTTSENWTQSLKNYLEGSFLNSFSRDWAGYDIVGNLDFVETVIHFLIIFSIIGSVIMWLHALRGFIFLIADYFVIYREEGRRQWFWIIIILINLFIFYKLYHIWWP